MNHAEWKTRRHGELTGEAADGSPEYDRLYEEAELAHDLGQMVYDRDPATNVREAEHGRAPTEFTHGGRSNAIGPGFLR